MDDCQVSVIMEVKNKEMNVKGTCDPDIIPAVIIQVGSIDRVINPQLLHDAEERIFDENIKPSEALLYSQVDRGSQRSITNKNQLLSDYRKLHPNKPRPRLLDSGAKMVHVQVSFGYLYVSDVNGMIFRVPSYHIPGMPHTIISPGDMCHLDHHIFSSYLETSNIYTGKGILTFYGILKTSDTTKLPTEYLNNLNYIRIFKVNVDEESIIHISWSLEYTLWHQRFNHANQSSIIFTSKAVTGMPKKLSPPHALNKCDMCLNAKITKVAYNSGSTRHETISFVGLILYFGFVCQEVKDKARVNDLTSYNENRDYLLVLYHSTTYKAGVATNGKTPLVELLRLFFKKIS